MREVTTVGRWVLLVMVISSRAHADPGAPPGAPASVEPGEVKLSTTDLLFGAEVAVKPSVYNGMSEPTVSTETAVVGIEAAGARTRHERLMLLEWGLTFRLKIGVGLPADTYPGTDRTVALGFQLAGRVEYGVLPLRRKCGTPYVSAGVGTEIKSTAMFPSGGDSHDGFSTSTPDGRADLYARAGLGLACVSDDLVLVVSPFVAGRRDSIAVSSGVELGGRGALFLARSVTATLEVATMATNIGGNSDRTTRAALSVRNAVGPRFLIGADATVTRNDLDHTSDVVYNKKITPFAVAALGAVVF